MRALGVGVRTGAGRPPGEGRGRGALALALAFNVALRAWLCALRALRALRVARCALRVALHASGEWEMHQAIEIELLHTNLPNRFCTRTQLSAKPTRSAARMAGALFAVTKTTLT